MQTKPFWGMALKMTDYVIVNIAVYEGFLYYFAVSISCDCDQQKALLTDHVVWFYPEL